VLTLRAEGDTKEVLSMAPGLTMTLTSLPESEPCFNDDVL
jgi:hypothetical protein